MHGIDGDREQRALLPFKHMALGVGVKPDLRGAAPLDHEIDFLIKMLLGIERAGARHLDHVAAPFALGAVKLNVSATAAKASPWCKRQVLHSADPDIAEHRNALG